MRGLLPLAFAGVVASAWAPGAEARITTTAWMLDLMCHARQPTSEAFCQGMIVAYVDVVQDAACMPGTIDTAQLTAAVVSFISVHPEYLEPRGGLSAMEAVREALKALFPCRR